MKILNQDAECIELLTRAGVLDKLEISEPFTHANYVWADDENFYLATKDIGHADPAENGFCIVVIPRTECTQQEAAALFAKAISMTTFGVVACGVV